ncbi:MAG TPA: hypothetical protein VFH58_11885 [Acidimicrobiales bacterium]|nr:hypothetical protein [Acidimicrobiales bacterium]
MTRPRRTAPLLALAAAVLASALLAACGGGSAGSSPYFRVTRMTSSAGQKEILLTPRVPVRGLVLFEHGYGETELALLRTPVLMPLRDTLLRAGYAMAASDSHGNNMGTLQSVHDQQLLLTDAERKLPAIPRVEMVGFSMGGLDALLVASRHAVAGLDGVVLLSPVCNQVPFLKTSLDPAIRAAFGNKQGQALLDAMEPSNPERQDAHSYAGYRYWFWQSPDDRTVPPAQTASMIALLHSAGIEARFSPLTGGHGDLKALQPEQVLQWFETGR